MSGIGGPHRLPYAPEHPKGSKTRAGSNWLKPWRFKDEIKCKSKGRKVIGVYYTSSYFDASSGIMKKVIDKLFKGGVVSQALARTGHVTRDASKTCMGTQTSMLSHI